MPGMPSLPVDVDPTVRQEDGKIDKEPVYQTHRGKKPTSRDEGTIPPQVTRPDGWMRYEQE